MPLDLEYFKYCFPDSKYYRLSIVYSASASFSVMDDDDDFLTSRQVKDDGFGGMYVPDSCIIPHQAWKLQRLTGKGDGFYSISFTYVQKMKNEVCA